MLKRTRSAYRQVKAWYKRYERWLMPGVLLWGFVMDLFTFRTLNLNISILILGIHLAIIAVGILLVYGVRLPEQGIFKYPRLFLPLVMQYSYGALFSAYVVLYGSSGALSASWPFLLALVALSISTEVFKSRFESFVVRYASWYLALLCWLILWLPVRVHELSEAIFIWSGIVSVGLALAYIYLGQVVGKVFRANVRSLLLVTAGVYALINVSYFTGSIPPIPLTLRDAGVYYSVTRVGDTYQALAPKQSWFGHLRGEMPLSGSSTLYFYSAIFAPAKLTTGIVHHWERWNTSTNRWQSVSVVDFPIVGGRQGGYRGYSFSSQISPGRYRVSVETENGLVLGRKTFRAVSSDGRLETVEMIK